MKCEANINVFSLPNLTPGPLEITLESLIAEKGSMHRLPDFLSWSVLSCLSFSSTLQILAISLLTCVHRWTSHACSSMARPRLKVATRTTGYVALRHPPAHVPGLPGTLHVAPRHPPPGHDQVTPVGATSGGSGRSADRTSESRTPVWRGAWQELSYHVLALLIALRRCTPGS